MEMKRVIFLGSKHFGEKNDVGVLAKQSAAALQGQIDVTHCTFEDLLFTITEKQRSIIDTASGVDLAEADLVIAMNWYSTSQKSLRDLAFTVALYLQEHGVKFWNSEMILQRSTTKLSAMWQLRAADVPVPDTVFSLNHQAAAATWRNEQAIVKDIAGSRGRNNYLVHTHEELERLLADKPDTHVLVQQFIPNDYDVRVVCFGGEPRLVIKRQRQSDDTHLNNTSQGGQATLLSLEKLPPEIIERTKKICQLTGREMAGIDYLVANNGTDAYICLEVNAIPQLTSGSFTSEKYEQLSDTIRDTLGKD
ncbi:MAG TPA: ATP-grasp domain-containing protein [Candidatus Saccharimonadales bacterium]|nr:ATP-grasp domain-containing protein [Candidatus Saccharimonadales bacterium]